MSVKKSATIDTTTVNELAHILKETDLTEIEVESGEMRIRVSREVPTQYIQASTPAALATAAPAAAPSTAPVAAAPAEAASPSASGTEVPAPMVGTVYMAPAPGADEFVKIGSNVKEGETLLIIEAMKVMNQIPAPKSGKVTSFLVEDGDPVEYGQPLLVIE
ncbi:MAG: acetyl-CoA carboxylase biotin carboxyl carrier protein [Pseudomonadota bacterium]